MPVNIVNKPQPQNTPERHEVAPGRPSATTGTQIPGLPTVSALESEIYTYYDMLVHKKDLPVGGIMGLMETANTIYARVNEVCSIIQTSIRHGKLTKGGEYDKLRTGELRLLAETAKRGIDVGSRRLSLASYELEAASRGIDTPTYSYDDDGDFSE